MERLTEKLSVKISMESTIVQKMTRIIRIILTYYCCLSAFDSYGLFIPLVFSVKNYFMLMNGDHVFLCQSYIRMEYYLHSIIDKSQS